METWFADVAFPADRVTLFYCFLDVEHHLVKREVEKGIVHSVVWNLKCEVFSERMMGETGERYVFFRIAYAVGKLRWGVFGT